MSYTLITNKYKDIPVEILKELRVSKSFLICWGEGYPQDFPYLVVDTTDRFRAKFNSLDDAKTFVKVCGEIADE